MADYSQQDFLQSVPDASELKAKKIAVITAQWNSEITGKMREGALAVLAASGVSANAITKIKVPGAFELSYAANKAALDGSDAIICLGCVIQGETPHFDFICAAVAHGITQVSLHHNIPVAFGVLTTNSQEQALERVGGKHGHKGEEAAVTVLQLLLN